MCQMNVYLNRGDKEEMLVENVTELETVEGGINLSSLFEDKKFIPDVIVKKINFTGGTVTLTPLI